MKTILLTLLAAVLAAATVLPTTAPAIVPPKACKAIKVDGKKHRIRADGVTCRFARRKGRIFLDTRREPRGYDCDKYPGSSLKTFNCAKGTTKKFYGLKPR